MKTKHVKLFEEFLKEEGLGDALSGMGGGGEEEKKKEDPIKKMQDEEKKKKENLEKKFQEFVDKKVKAIKSKLDEYPDIKKDVGNKIFGAIESQDRVKIHNAVNDLIYIQVKYQEEGSTTKVSQVSVIKTMLDDLDKSYTSDKHI